MKIFHSPGQILREGSYYYVDQLKEDRTLIWNGYIEGYLNNTYGITSQQYYNLIVNGDINSPNRCPICQNPTNYIGRLSRGYHETCSPSCRSSLQIQRMRDEGIEPMSSENFLAARKKAQEDLWNSNSHPFQTVEVHAKSRRTLFSSQGSPSDICYLYWTKTDDKNLFKIGITADISIRSEFMRGWYTKINPITSNLREAIAELEYKVKIHFDTRSEYFEISRFKSVLTYIKSII